MKSFTHMKAKKKKKNLIFGSHQEMRFVSVLSLFGTGLPIMN